MLRDLQCFPNTFSCLYASIAFQDTSWICFLLQVFDVHINNLVAVKQLDIYDKVGKGVAHDEYIPFTVSKGHLHFESQFIAFSGSLRVDFVKVCDGYYKCFFTKCLLLMLSVLSTGFSDHNVPLLTGS